MLNSDSKSYYIGTTPVFNIYVQNKTIYTAALANLRFTVDLSKSTPTNEFFLPLLSGIQYTFIIDWGDNNIERVITRNTTGVLHTYSVPATTYNISITSITIPGFSRIYFNNNPVSRNKLTRVDSYGSLLSSISLANAWFGCSSLVALPTANFVSALDFSSAWENCTSLTAFPFVSAAKGTNFSRAWYNCVNLSATEFPTINMSSMLSGENCFFNVKLTTRSYTSLLTSLYANNTNSNVRFHGGNSDFFISASAGRDFLINSKQWVINDGSYIPNQLYTNNTGILTSTDIKNLGPYDINWYWNGLTDKTNLVTWSDTSSLGSLPRTWLP